MFKGQKNDKKGKHFVKALIVLWSDKLLTSSEKKGSEKFKG